MSISFICKCGKALNVDDEYAGKRAQCPFCKRVMRVPASPSEGQLVVESPKGKEEPLSEANVEQVEVEPATWPWIALNIVGALVILLIVKILTSRGGTDRTSSGPNAAVEKRAPAAMGRQGAQQPDKSDERLTGSLAGFSMGQTVAWEGDYFTSMLEGVDSYLFFASRGSGKGLPPPGVVFAVKAGDEQTGFSYKRARIRGRLAEIRSFLMPDQGDVSMPLISPTSIEPIETSGGKTAGKAEERPSGARKTPPPDEKPAPPKPVKKPSTDLPEKTSRSDWYARVLNTQMVQRYSEGPKGSEIEFAPPGGRFRIALVEVEFMAHAALPGAPEKRVDDFRDRLGDPIADYLSGRPSPIRGSGNEGKHLVQKPAALFVSYYVRLTEEGGDSVMPSFTSQPEGYGLTIEGDRFFDSMPKSSAPVVLRYFREGALTAAIIQPKRKTRLTFVFVVPGKLRKAKLEFYNYPHIDVRFIPDREWRPGKAPVKRRRRAPAHNGSAGK